MKYFYVAAILGMVAAVVAWAIFLPDHPAEMSPKMVQQMNAIDPGKVFYSTICFKGKKLIRIQNSYFYELDNNEHLIPCVK